MDSELFGMTHGWVVRRRIPGSIRLFSMTQAWVVGRGISRKIGFFGMTHGWVVRRGISRNIGGVIIIFTQMNVDYCRLIMPGIYHSIYL